MSIPAPSPPGRESDVQSAWQPIETAPKDGTKILVFTIHGDVEVSEYCVKKHVVYDPVGDGLFKAREEIWGEFWNGSCRPTHWMALPDPPAATP
jgi:hypothetical protein